MADENYTTTLLVIDRSGSMATIRDEMVGALTTLLEKQAAEEGMLTVDMVTFDNVIERQDHFADPQDVVIRLEPRGGTALYDALGISIGEFGRELAALPAHARPGTVQVVVVTDGEENSSQEYSLDAVRALITEQKEKYSWDFVFLGANQDAVLTGASLGIDADSSLTYAADADGVAGASETLHRYMTSVRKK
ncbi:vWA domain-containing protein [Cryobacterium sp. BB736]|uniref:vWA domain-containing protein n=1 Tax=Cryobacterium sp. BB736 TaxID=2746963 RepID=UPI001873581D|nr:vWA domain-containing protein [Cryobacterium sp. BB736]